MTAISIGNMSSTQLCLGAAVGMGSALAFGTSIAIGALGGAAIAGVASLVSCKCFRNRKHQSQVRFEQRLPTDQVPLPTSSSLPLEQGSSDPVPNSCAETRFAPSNVDLKNIQTNVIHLGQSHWINGLKNDPNATQRILRIWNSQKAIAKYLLANPTAEVFIEGRDKTSENAQLDHPENYEIAHELFPNGFPSDLDAMNSSQREFFMRVGAAGTLHYFGKIKKLHRAISPERYDEREAAMNREFAKGNRNPYSNELKPLVFDQPEEALIEEIKVYLHTAKDTNRQIVIVFGSGHNFAKYFDPKKFQCIPCQ